MILRSGRWDAERWGAPINQHDMAGTQLLFSLAVLEGLRTLGFRITTTSPRATCSSGATSAASSASIPS